MTRKIPIVSLGSVNQIKSIINNYCEYIFEIQREGRADQKITVDYKGEGGGGGQDYVIVEC